MDLQRIGVGTLAGLIAGIAFGMLMHMMDMIQMVDMVRQARTEAVASH